MISGEEAAIVDPVFDGLKRNRVNAETIKAVVAFRQRGADASGFSDVILRKLAERILRCQSAAGSWNEIHPRYDRPSPLATAFIAEALLDLQRSAPELASGMESRIDDSLARARDYVLAHEIRPGFFLKSEGYRADHLNADASCGAFLAKYATENNDAVAKAAAGRVVAHCSREQFPDGAYPYTTVDDGPPYPFPLHVPCIHYQGVTGYYLAKIDLEWPNLGARDQLLRAATWLQTIQREDGRFDWSRSRMMFAYRLTGAYAFAAALFGYVARWDRQFTPAALASLRVLDSEVPSLANRWEAGSPSLPRDVRSAWRAGRSPEFPLTHKVLRIGHALYRETARRRFSQRAEDGWFRVLHRVLRLKTSTVEPHKNYPDLFMTAEVVDCLGFLDLLAPTDATAKRTIERVDPQ